MSKNNEKRNYFDYASIATAEETTVTEVIEETVEEATAIEETVPDVVMDEEEIQEEPKCDDEVFYECVYGIVCNCARLNVRLNPNAKAKIETVIDADTQVMVIPDESTEEWYAVVTESGVEGYCMKGFIKLIKNDEG